MASSRTLTEEELRQLIGAARRGDQETLESFVRRGFDVNTRDSSWFNRTLLHLCASNGHLDASIKLIQLGADVNATGNNGKTPLHVASFLGEAKVVDLLINRGATVNATDKNGKTPLHTASFDGYAKIIDLLINRGATVNATDKDGDTPLHVASSQGHVNVLEVLINRGATVNETNNNGVTPLRLAALFNHSAVVWTLVHDHKVDYSQYDEWIKPKISELLAAEEMKMQSKQRKDPSLSTDNGAIVTTNRKQGTDADDKNMKLAYSRALRFGIALSKDLQVLFIGAENSGKSCLIASYLGEAFIEGQAATEGTQMDVCKIYCKNWSRMSISDMETHLHHQFISQLQITALEALPRISTTETTVHPVADLKSIAPTKSANAENLPKPNPEDVAEASSHAPSEDPDSLNATVLDFAGQVIFHNTHSVFISENGVPVITFNASMELTADVAVREGSAPPAECHTIISGIHHWLQVVHSMCSVKGGDDDHSPLLPTALLAGIQIDKLHANIKEARKIAKRLILPLLEKELLNKPYARHLAGMKKGIKYALEQFCFFISNKFRDEEMDRLKQATVVVATSLRNKQPIFFLKIERSLLVQKEEIISKSKFAEIVADCSFAVSEDSSEFEGILSYFHAKRAILHFKNVKSLKNLVILSPRWLSQLFSYVITASSYVTGTELDSAWKQLKSYGILHENLLVHMLDKFRSDYPTVVPVTMQQVMDILLCFHIVTVINREAWFTERGYPSLPKTGKAYLVPSLVPRDNTKAIPNTKDERIIYYNFEEEFVPTSVLNQLIAECICRNVERKSQLLWMRHGMVALQLGAHQKYYISRCEEKASLQLTITVAETDLKCVHDREELIKDVAKLLRDIMKMFMPATAKPKLFVPCPKCSTLHITLQQVYDGGTIYCASSSYDHPLRGHYSDLLPNALAGADTKLKVFRKYYAKLTDVLPIKRLTRHFIASNVISFEEENEILATVGQCGAASLFLRKIGHSLEAGLTTSFDILLTVVEEHGGTSCVELLSDMRQELPQRTTGTQFNWLTATDDSEETATATQSVDTCDQSTDKVQQAPFAPFTEASLADKSASQPVPANRKKGCLLM